MSVETVKVIGLASGKIIKDIDLQPSDHSLSLMDFLRKNQVTVASSCNGEGVCKKCAVNNDVISCQIKTLDFLNLNTDTITISYL